MKTREKLELAKELEARNKERIEKYQRTAGVHKALEIHANSIIDSLDILAERYRLPREELLESLILTLRATNEFKAKPLAED